MRDQWGRIINRAIHANSKRKNEGLACRDIINLSTLCERITNSTLPETSPSLAKLGKISKYLYKMNIGVQQEEDAEEPISEMAN